MRQSDFIASVAYQNKRLRSELDDLNTGRRKVFLDGKDISASELDRLRHRIVDNITIIRSLSHQF